MSRPRLSNLGSRRCPPPTWWCPQQPLLDQRHHAFEFGDVAVVAVRIGLVVASDLLARQAAPAGQQIVAVAGQEIVGLAKHDLEAVALQLEVADDLGCSKLTV